MRVCDRCRCPDPYYKNYYFCGKNCDLCESCMKEYRELTEVIDSMEQTFLKGKTLKHIDFQWEESQ